MVKRESMTHGPHSTESNLSEYTISANQNRDHPDCPKSDWLSSTKETLMQLMQLPYQKSPNEKTLEGMEVNINEKKMV